MFTPTGQITGNRKTISNLTIHKNTPCKLLEEHQSLFLLICVFSVGKNKINISVDLGVGGKEVAQSGRRREGECPAPSRSIQQL
jgi:hypothetical protein